MNSATGFGFALAPGRGPGAPATAPVALRARSRRNPLPVCAEQHVACSAVAGSGWPAPLRHLRLSCAYRRAMLRCRDVALVMRARIGQARAEIARLGREPDDPGGQRDGTRFSIRPPARPMRP
ncbi:hypothetical protein [Burkholderia sp. AU31280]|uniref:hypothetical protein n=1 Tax=Burkholderia sp. AU31280 TaxID=2015353 RepID=UPI00211AA6B4|nr:hypothetical protein [Burkholderia sp. AU31280]